MVVLRGGRVFLVSEVLLYKVSLRGSYISLFEADHGSSLKVRFDFWGVAPLVAATNFMHAPSGYLERCCVK